MHSLVLSRPWGVSAESGDNSGGTDQKSVLVGKWLVEVNDACAAGWAFNGSQYEGASICALESGTYGVETEIGSYSATDSRIDLVPEMASCVVNRNFAPYSFLFTVSGNALRLTSNEGVVVFEKISDDPNDLAAEGGGGVARHGCLEPDGFYDGEIVPVN